MWNCLLKYMLPCSNVMCIEFSRAVLIKVVGLICDFSCIDAVKHKGIKMFTHLRMIVKLSLLSKNSYEGLIC